MKHIEMHCHSNLSDWRNTQQEVITEAIRLNLDFLALTDHDTIAPNQFQQALREAGIATCDSVEISAVNTDLDKSLHLVSYAKIFQQSLHDILDTSRIQKSEMYSWQLKKLSSFWLDGDWEWFEEYMQRKHKRWLKSANKWFLSQYLFSLPGNKSKMKHIVWESLWEAKNVVEVFYNECLKREWRLFEIYGYEVPEYEPTVQQTVEEVVTKSGWILSMAHPNVTFWGNKWGIPEFERTLENYVDKGINAIEINTMASYEWVQAILQARRKYNLILTFGSDCHQIGYDWVDGKHSTIWKQNSHMYSLDFQKRFYRWTSVTEDNFKLFQEAVWLT